MIGDCSSGDAQVSPTNNPIDGPAHVKPRFGWKSQTVFPVDNEPLAVCIADDKLLVATMGHFVEVRNLDGTSRYEDGGKIDHTFCTVDLVKQIVYSNFGTYVATLEVKTSRQNLTTRIRTYLNWQVKSAGPMRARIAGRVTPSSQCGVGQLEMVELPLHKKACFIACCKSTGNLAVSCGCSVNIFVVCLKTHDISKQKFHDWDHLMEVYLTFPIKELSLCEEFLACSSANDVQVIQIKQSCDPDQTQPTLTTTTTAPIKRKDAPRAKAVFSEDDPDVAIDDEFSISWNDYSSVGCGENVALNHLKEKLDPASWPLTIHLPSLSQPSIYVDQSNHPVEIVGPMKCFPGYPVKLEYGGDPLNISSQAPTNFVQFDAISLLYRRFAVPLPNSANQQFCIHSLQFSPLYLSDHGSRSALCKCPGAVVNPLHSNQRDNLCRLEIMFSGQRHGFLYNLLGTVKLVSEFTFFSDIYCLALEGNIFHAVTQKELATYSVGKWERTLQFFDNYQGESSMSELHQQQTVALAVHPFINIHFVACGNGALILLTNYAADSISKESNAGWTAYALHCPTPEEFYHDLMHYSAEGVGVDPGGVDTRFLYEAHSALAAEVLVYRPPPSSRLTTCFQDATCRLASHHLTSSEGDLSDAEFFYGMSGLEMQSIVTKILAAKTEAYSEEAFGNRVERLLTQIFIKNDTRKPETLMEDTANEVLNILATTPEFSLVFLKGCFGGYTPGKALEFVKRRLCSSEKTRALDVVAACVLCSHMGLSDEFRIFLQSISTELFLDIAVAYPSIWLLQSEPDLQFSSLFQTLQKSDARIFVRLMLQLLRSEIVPNNLVALLCKTDWEELGLSPRTDRMLVLFLEEYLTDASMLDQDCTEAVVSLSSLYLKFLANLDPKSSLESREKSWSVFGPRSAWLNNISPFQGHSMLDPCMKRENQVSQPIVQEQHCWCISCNDCLFRFQSLLCSPLACRQVKTAVGLSISAATTLRGALSLQVLCSLSPVDGVRILIENNATSVVMEYCKDIIDSNSSQWRQLLVLLMDKGESDDLSEEIMESISTLLDGVVDELAELLTPVELITTLPLDQEKRFMSKVQRCISKHQANNLRNIIIAKGQELKAIV